MKRTTPRQFVGFQTALKRTLSKIKPLKIVEKTLADSVGCVSAEILRARVDAPSADVSMKDGYAVRSVDIESTLRNTAAKMRLNGVAAAGEKRRLAVGPGSAVRVLTGALLPENAIISDEALTSGLKLPICTAGARRHDVLTVTGGAIGQGLPVAIGAAIAGKDAEGLDRSVIAMVGDGSAMYTIQSLWTMMNENLDVTVIVLNNRSYAVLNIELERVGAEGAGPKAKSQLDLSKTEIDFVAMAKGMGMPAETATTAEEFNDALGRAIREPGPHLIDAIVPSEYEGLKLKILPHLLGAMNKVPSPIAKALKKKIAP